VSVRAILERYVAEYATIPKYARNKQLYFMGARAGEDYEAADRYNPHPPLYHYCEVSFGYKLPTGNLRPVTFRIKEEDLALLVQEVWIDAYHHQ